MEKKKVYHQGKKLFSVWLTEEENLKAQLLSKQYGVSKTGLVRLIINQPYGSAYVKSLHLDREGEDHETGNGKGD